MTTTKLQRTTRRGHPDGQTHLGWWDAVQPDRHGLRYVWERDQPDGLDGIWTGKRHPAWRHADHLHLLWQRRMLGGNACTNDYYHTYALWTKNAKGHVSTITYDYIIWVLPLSETDPNGAVTSATYDEYGRFTSLTKPGETTPSLNVTYVNSPFKVTLEQTIQGTQKFKLVRNYDGLGRQTLTVTDNTIIVSSTFDAYGRALTQSTPYAGTETAYYSTTTYDALGRPLTMTAPDGTVTSYNYNGLYSTVTDGKGNKTTTETNILGWTLSVTPKDSSGLPFGPNVDYEYDELGNLTFVSRGGADLTLTYDKAGRKLTMNDPDMGVWSYAYNALGNMTQPDRCTRMCADLDV